MFNEKGNRECEKSENNSDHKIYASMTHMYSNEECSNENMLSVRNWPIGFMFHMTPEVSDINPGSLQDKDKYIEAADRHHVTAKPKGQVQIKMCNHNGKPFIATLHNVLLA